MSSLFESEERRGAFAFLIGTVQCASPDMPDTANYLSKDKFEELTAELEQLKTVRRREIAEQLEYARSLGDLSENAEYEEARNMQEHKISHLSPLGSALMGKKKGDVFSFDTPKGMQKYKIVTVK